MVILASRLAVRVQSNIGIIRAGVNQGLSSNAIQDLIRSTGQAGIRRQDLLQGIRHARGIVETGTNLRSIRKDRLPDPSRFEVSRNPMLSEFSYDIEVRGRSPLSGQIESRFVTVRSDRNLTPGQIEDEVGEMFEESDDPLDRYNLSELASITIVGGRIRG